MYNSYFKLLSIAIIFAALSGCGSLNQVTEPVIQGKGIAMLKIVAAAGSPFQKLAKKATLTISASDMLTMSKTLTITDSSVEGTISGIPAGKSRLFAVAVVDSLDTLQYRGSSLASVIADSTVKVSINVTRVSGNAIIDGNIIEGALLGMKYISSGTFQMGQAGVPYALPVHSVTVSSFFMDSTLVTQAAYLSLMGVNPANFTGDSKRPVEMMTWFDAVLYCNKRSQRDGKDTVYSFTGITGTPGNGCTALAGLTINYAKNGYRLPTEAEFEYACRAGTTTPYYWGNDTTVSVMGNYAWYYLNSNNVTQAVAGKLPNAFGLYDMSGNVFEVCNDWAGVYSSAVQTDPTGPTSGTVRIVRGGVYNYMPGEGATLLGSGYRDTAHCTVDPAHPWSNVGFRCVCGI